MPFYRKAGLLFLVLVLMMKTGWSQDVVKKSTAMAAVRVLDTAFYMPQLKRYRRIWIYLPKNYYHVKGRLPVLYLHDGQNVFDAATAFSDEWGVDEALDSLSETFGNCVVVAIDNGGDQRLSEYSPYDFTLNHNGGQVEVKGAGDAYVDFLVKTLRPYLQRSFRISRRSSNHFIAGSSMGGLISLYSLLKYPRKWGGAGVFSPAFWVVKEKLVAALEQQGSAIRCPIYLYAGEAESKDMVPDMLLVSEVLNRVSRAPLTTVIRAGETHSEASWRKEFPFFYQWLMQRK